MAFRVLLLLVFSWLSLTFPSSAQQVPSPGGFRDLGSDTWVGTDALGRVLPTRASARAPQPDKFVGVFYFVWHSRSDEPYDTTKLLAANPANPQYGPIAAFHWWGEPAVGYFRADDPWVARKNLQMLGDAGVDVLFLDVTNGPTYTDDVRTLFETATAMRREGTKTPQIAFLTHSSCGPVANSLYDTYYAHGLYKDLWFQWGGKPLILGEPNGLPPDAAPPRPEVKQFFTWRRSWAWDPGQDKWQWIDKYPQKFGWHADPKIPEEVAVSVAGHPTDELGRSYHSAGTWGGGTEPPVDNHFVAADVDKGLQFAQQWEGALKIDPQFIFVTGWNEWIAQRFVSGPGGGPNFLGHLLKPGQTFFVDNLDEEFSRDIMPMQGGYGDDYYMQLVDGIRRFKGVRPAPISHGFQSISLADFTPWNRIEPRYLDAVGDVTHRDWDGWKGHRYANTTGRNDIVSAKVACGAKSVAFFVHTAQPLTPYTDPNWMQLLIDADQNPATGWHGYDFVVNSRVLSATQTTLKRLSDGKTWPVRYRAVGDDIAVIIPRVLLRLTDTAHTAFDFHWIDNVPVGPGGADMADWWYDGDSAPDGRFNYRYENTGAVR